MTLNLKQNDRKPWFVAQCRDADGEGVVLTGATSVVIIMRKQGTTGTPKLRTAVELLTTQPPIPAEYSDGEPVTDLDGWVRYKWAAADTDTVGTYDVEIEATWSDGPQTFPTVGYETVNIQDDLDA